jgi:hypothetical protein
MNYSISIILGNPEHGWLPVDIHYRNFHLDFDASDVLNDPIEELYNLATKLQDNELRRITWWLEPRAYFFDFTRKGQLIDLTIVETDDFNRDSAEKKELITITGSDKEVIEPFRIALRNFFSQTYEEKHWPYNMDKNKINNL